MPIHRTTLVLAATWLVACGSSAGGGGDAADARPDDVARDGASIGGDALDDPDALLDAVGDDALDATTPGDDGGGDDGGRGDVLDVVTPTDAPPATYHNFVLDQNGDPFCARFGDRYYIYVPDQIPGGGRVLGFTSTDLVNWTRLGAVFDNVDEMRGGQHSTGLWAPEVLSYGGRYYLYFASLMEPAAPDSAGDRDIEVVASGDPTDFHGGARTVLLDDAYAFIDPDPFVDPGTGRLYLVFKRRGMVGTGSEIDVRPMDSPTSFSGPRAMLIDSDHVPNSDHTTEQPTMWRAGSQYYLLFSANDGGGTQYRIAYATATDPMGPFTLRDTLFQSSADLSGDLSHAVISPGSSSIVRDGAMDTWMVYRQKTMTAETFADREIAIDRVTFDPATHSIAGTPSHGVERRAPVAP